MPNDAVYAVRQLRGSPVFTAAAVLTLALGIGANTAIYQVLDAILFRPLPVRDPARLVQVHVVENGEPRNFSYPEFRDFAAQSTAAEGMIAISDFPLHAAILRGHGQAHPVNAVIVSPEYFRVLGVEARQGRVFTTADDHDMVAVISDAFWQREFGRSASAIGQRLHINKSILTVIGIAPPRFTGETPGNSPDIWVPMGLTPRLLATDWMATPKSWLTVVARLRPGVSLTDAGREFAGTVSIQPAARGVNGPISRYADPSSVLMGGVGLLLIIACCNLATLLLGRAAARSHEVSVRLALGASRARIVRQLLAESAVLAAAGAVLGVAAAHWAARALASLVNISAEWNWRVLAFTAAATVLATILFGFAPARAATRPERGRRGAALARALIAAQTAIALLLLSGAGLLSRSLSNLRNQDFGFTPGGLTVADLPWEFSPAMMARYAALQEPLLDCMRAIPGVTSAALSGFGPMGDAQHTGRVSIPGGRPIGIRIVHVSSRYFETAGIPILAGRGFADSDRAGSRLVAVLTRSAARMLFEGSRPVGRSVSLGNDAIEVIGLAPDVRFGGPAEPFAGLLFLPLAQSPSPITAALVRAAPHASGVASGLRAALRATDPDQAVAAIRPATEVVDSRLGQERLLALLSTGFAAVALVLASVGVYGVISYAVERRTREIGIRLAIGARRSQVMALLAGEVAAVGGAGMLVGALAHVWLAPAIRSVLFGVRPGDYTTLLAAALLLAAIAALAAYLPARRAARLDPMRALRVE